MISAVAFTKKQNNATRGNMAIKIRNMLVGLAQEDREDSLL